jgi:hypothetical protein
MSLSNISADDSIPSGEWTLYFHSPREKKWSLDSYTELGTASSWRDVFALTNALGESRLKGGMYFWMRKGIPPLWENYQNIRGGSYSLRGSLESGIDIFLLYTIGAMLDLATVKGDVHDIGKNIVGVVLSCNNYEIEDLGVMVPPEKILARAKEWGADIIGLSGLITPSLDEMVHIAKEMERLEMKIPLLIGGATTSRIHTAVKIDPHYSGPVVHVLDASRSVPVVGKLLGEESADFISSIKKEYLDLRESHAKRESSKNILPYEEALCIRLRVESPSVKPNQTGIFSMGVEVGKLVSYIDWTPFVQAGG